MLLSDVVERLRRDGLGFIEPQRIRYAINAGHLERPLKNTACIFDFNESQYAQVKRYFLNPPKPGRKKQAVLDPVGV